MNVEYLVRLNVPLGLLEQTGTTLNKAYSDATQEFREFLSSTGLHFYELQPQGQDAKVVKAATIIDGGNIVTSEVALYRPNTKNGDPRFRISNIKRICQPGDISVVFFANDHLYVRRLDQSDFETDLESPGPMHDALGAIARERVGASAELLDMLRTIGRRGYIKSLRVGDTGVGHLLETELGIKANSSKAPDFKGIEIKSTRAKVPTRQTMFAKVPNWSMSSVSGTSEFLRLFGYDRRGFLELNCEVSATRPNSRGLRLRTTQDKTLLEEFNQTESPHLSLRWTLESIRTALQEKHAETFWVKASSDRRADGEYIRFDTVIHTSRPVLQQVAPLLDSGSITVDHLISDKPNRGVREQGPLFKISSRDFDLLFPRIDVHDLRSR